jgi:hypothetical protein
MSQRKIHREEIENDRQMSDQVEEGPVKQNSKIPSIADRFMTRLKSRTGWHVFLRCQGGITEKFGAYDDVYVARSEQEKNDAIGRLQEEIRKMDMNKKPYTFDSIGAFSHD